MIKAVTDRGLNVPQDISIISIDGIMQSRFTVPTLTTVVQPIKEIARISTQILVDCIEKGEENSHITLPTKLRLGQSLRYQETPPL